MCAEPNRYGMDSRITPWTLVTYLFAKMNGMEGWLHTGDRGSLQQCLSIYELKGDDHLIGDGCFVCLPPSKLRAPATTGI